MIVDASVAFKWVVEEDDSWKARDWLAREPLRAPGLVCVEVGNALWKKSMRGEIADPKGSASQLARLPELVSVEPEAVFMAAALLLAVELEHAIYDCVYLAMAIALDVRLLTADARFIRKLNGTHADRVVPL